MRRLLTYWFPPIIWAAVILSASTDAFSASNTGGWLERITAWLGYPLAPSTHDLVNHVIRKIAHVTEYGIFSALSFRALRGERTRWTLRWAIGAVVLAAFVASIDEFHQTFVPSRTGTWHDVVLDTAGATFMQIIIRAAQVLFFRRS
ncbi:MAG: VanZ family protein [Acidobacteriota bacterium]|nr:VanZ family protein [Acidobacteriota bacterium]